MAKTNQDMIIYSNNDINIRFEDIIKEDTGALLSVGDILGASWAITPFEDDVAPLVSKDMISGGITVPEDGVVLVSISASDTIDLSGEFTHELRLKHSGGVQTASRGKVRILYQVAVNPL